MHHIEPYFLWKNLYDSSEDPRSPFYGREYSEIYFTHSIYDHIIHPQWDGFGSDTLFLKMLYVDYEESVAIIELIGEWNDCLYNDIMKLKRDVIDQMLEDGISRFILIGENVLNFHASDDSYYEEWFEDVPEGWIALVNMHPHVLSEMKAFHINDWLMTDEFLNDMDWRGLRPLDLCAKIQQHLDHFLR